MLFFLGRGRLRSPKPLVQTGLRYSEALGHIFDLIAALQDLPHCLLPEFRRVLLLAHPYSIVQLLREVSRGPWESSLLIFDVCTVR